LIYAVRVDDDPLVSELVRAEQVEQNVLIDQRENRLIPVEISVINVGYRDTQRTYASLPPRPPMSLSDVRECPRDVVEHFISQFEFFSLILNAPGVPSDELLAASLRYAARTVYPPAEHHDLMVRAGQQLVRLVGGDLKRLNHLLALLRP
jgi:hypothetical protein